jgi:CelD/BcsL family acetyltransferase involved in cellulose biosynthesis
MHGLEIRPLTPSESYADLLRACRDWTLYHVPEWLAFLDDVAPGRRLELGIYRGGCLVGLLPGREVRIGPLRLFGSPMPGWCTEYMGPVWMGSAGDDDFFAALERYLADAGFHHAEISRPPPAFPPREGWATESGMAYQADLTPDGEAMMAGFTKSCRKSIRRAQRAGVTVSFTDDEKFIDIYYSQLQEVFAKRDQRPTYSLERVRSLWRHMRPTGRLLTAWASVDGEVIATRIDLVGKSRLRSFGSASRQTALHYCPNELLRYFVMAWAGKQGLETYEMTGGGYYKEKFGANPVEVVRFIRSPSWLRLARNAARWWVYWRTRGANTLLSDASDADLEGGSSACGLGALERPETGGQEAARLAPAAAAGIRFEPLDFSAVPWQELDAMPDRTVFQTREWLQFVQETQKATPVVAAVRDGNDTLGYFTGMVVRKFGIKVLGSPFPGWTTGYMGFNLRPGVSRRQVLAALPEFAFDHLGCMHLEIMDRHCTAEDYEALGWDYRSAGTFEVDLTADEETIFRRMKQGSCRWSIRKAAKSGVVTAEVSDDSFAEEYYGMLQDVFDKQALVPTYKLDRVVSLMRFMLPTGRLLPVRARSPDGASIATGIFPAFNTTMTFWGGASWRQYQKLQPNEAVIWHAMRYWKERGMQVFDMGGGGEYKRKYGGVWVDVPWGRVSRFRLINWGRCAAEEVASWQQRLRGCLHKVAGGKHPAEKAESVSAEEGHGPLSGA